MKKRRDHHRRSWKTINDHARLVWGGTLHGDSTDSSDEENPPVKRSRSLKSVMAIKKITKKFVCLLANNIFCLSPSPPVITMSPSPPLSSSTLLFATISCCLFTDPPLAALHADPLADPPLATLHADPLAALVLPLKKSAPLHADPLAALLLPLKQSSLLHADPLATLLLPLKKSALLHADPLATLLLPLNKSECVDVFFVLFLCHLFDYCCYLFAGSAAAS